MVYIFLYEYLYLNIIMINIYIPSIFRCFSFYLLHTLLKVYYRCYGKNKVIVDGAADAVFGTGNNATGASAVQGYRGYAKGSARVSNKYAETTVRKPPRKSRVHDRYMNSSPTKRSGPVRCTV